MKLMNAASASLLVAGMLFVIAIAPPPVASQTAAGHVAHVDKQLADKQAALEVHRKQMEAIKDRSALDTEMRKHFQMTEEVLALMLERRKLTAAQPGSTPSKPQPPAQSQRGGMQGGMPGPGIGGGMMQKEMGGMQGGSMQGDAMPGMGAASPSSAGPFTTGDMDQMMRRIGEHSTYMETITDGTALQQEMLRHQKMLDQMMQLMQR